MQPFAEASLRKSAPLLGIRLLDIQGATCCPVPDITRLVSYDAWLNVAARNLSLAESMGKDILVLCNGCWETFYEACKEFSEEPRLLDEVNLNLSRIGRKFTGKVEVKHVLEVIVEDVGLDGLKEAIKRPLDGLSVTIQHGCKIYKSEEGKLVRYFDDVIDALGAKRVVYGGERICCGYPTMLASPDLSIKERTKLKLDLIKESKADCIAVVCPACYDQFEKAQFMLMGEGAEYNIPILHLTELVALSLGLSPEELGLHLHGIPCDAVTEKLR
ncbi:TPA: hypothetical protein EYP44_03630 [Candidatus Bathyarchaeota archaeon]|nr:hypothetical protein [Candidatus Bathyarchaeota archaeon]